MRETISRVLALLTAREKRRMMLLFLGVVAMAVFQVIGIASVMPFLSVVADPNTVENNPLINWVYTTLGFSSVNRFLLFLGFLVLVVLILSNVTSGFVVWAVQRFSWMRNHTISRRLLAAYLNKPYEFLLDQNTATLGRNILNETNQTIGGLVIPGMEMLANSVVAIFILLFLIIVDPVLALIVTATLGFAYGIVYVLVRRKLARLGEQRTEANRERFKIANEAFGDFKTVKLLHAQSHFVKSFSEHSFIFSDRLASGVVIARIPKYALETVAFGGLLLIVLYLLATQGDMAQVLPLIGLYAFAGYRLMPALQNTFQAAAQVRFSVASLNAIYEGLEGYSENHEWYGYQRPAISLPFEDRLELKNVTFRYPGTTLPVIQDLSLSVRAHSSVAFVGKTGSGKTTMADIILGLLTPETGEMSVDGVDVTPDNIAGWQRNLGYVPQEIYLRDDTVAQNIAFAEEKARIDMKAVERSAKIANIHEFITNELPQGYETFVGERGIRLSGGERQRIGIARAMYYDPLVVVLDEATSALDSATEREVFEAVENIAKAKTMIIIAHRLATVRNCDVVYVIEAGNIIAQGTYDELIDSCEVFRSWAKVHN